MQISRSKWPGGLPEAFADQVSGPDITVYNCLLVKCELFSERGFTNMSYAK